MDPIIGSALISAGGGLLQGLMGQSSANKQMRFQERSARHRYQWAMQDMKKAGLNPMLAYQQGGSPALGGAKATFENIGESAVRGATSAKQRQLMDEQLAVARATATNQQNQAASHAQDVWTKDPNALVSKEVVDLLETDPEFRALMTSAKVSEMLTGQPLFGAIAKVVRGVTSGKKITSPAVARMMNPPKTPKMPKRQSSDSKRRSDARTRSKSRLFE